MSDFNKIMELNNKIENSPVASKFIKVFIKILSIILIFMSLLLCVAQPIAGIIGVLFGVFIWVLSNSIGKKKSKQGNSHNDFQFPETDEHGHAILNVYDMNVSGVLHEYDGIDPQMIIPKLYEGEQIILEADPLNQYDKNAVKVKTINGIQIGWLEKGSNLQIDIFERLNSGQTVYARVKKGYFLDKYPGKVGLVIDVARYSKR